MNQRDDELDVVICFVIVYCSGVVTTTRIEYFVSKNNENPMTNFIRSLNLSNKFMHALLFLLMLKCGEQNSLITVFEVVI